LTRTGTNAGIGISGALNQRRMNSSHRIDVSVTCSTAVIFRKNCASPSDNMDMI